MNLYGEKDRSFSSCTEWWQPYLWRCSPSSTPYKETYRDWLFIDLNGDGKADIFSYDRDASIVEVHTQASAHDDLLTTTVSSSNVNISLEYSLASELPGAVKSGAATYPIQSLKNPIYLTTKSTFLVGLRSNSTAGPVPERSTREYKYLNISYRPDPETGGDFLGFATVRARDKIN